MSILSQKNELLKKKFINNISFVDLAFKNNQEIALYKGEALENAVLMWLMSSPGDYYDKPKKGGPLRDISLGSLMSPDNIRGFENQFIGEFEEVFGDKFSIIAIELTPDLRNKKFSLHLVVFDVLSKTYSDLNINLKD